MSGTRTTKKRARGDRFAFEKLVAASLTGAAFAAMLVAVAEHDGAPSGPTTAAITASGGLQSGSPTPPPAAGVDGEAVGQSSGPRLLPTPQATPIPRARRSRAS